MFECSWRRAGAKEKVTAEKGKAASSSKLQDHFKISKLLQVETNLFRISSNFLSALKTAKVLFQQVSEQGIVIVSRQPQQFFVIIVTKKLLSQAWGYQNYFI